MSKKRKSEKSAVQKASERIFGKWSEWWEGDPGFSEDGVAGERGGTTPSEGGGYSTRYVGDDEFGAGTRYGSGYGGSYYGKYDFNSGRSYSSRWVDHVGMGYSYSFYTDTSSKERQKLYKTLQQLARTANVVINSEQYEKNLYVQFASAEGKPMNDPNKTVLYISPDTILESKTPEQDGLVLDQLIGEVLIGATMKRTISPIAWKAQQEQPACPVTVWQAMEQAEARTDLMLNWQGFLPYVVRHTEAKCMSKSAFEEEIKPWMKTPDSGVACAILAWNILNPQDPVEAPESMRDIIEEWEEQLRGVPSANRFTAALSATDAIAKALGKPKYEPKRLGDAALFGIVTSGSKSSDLPDRLDITKYDASSVVLPDGVPPLPPNSTAVIRIEANPSGHLSQDYMATVAKLKKSIDAISQSLDFRKTVSTMPTFGHRSGDLDEGGLYKLAFNERDPAIWEKKEIRGAPELAVGLLVDNSGSMSPRIREAAECAIALTEAFMAIPKISVMVLGHTANYGVGSGENSEFKQIAVSGKGTFNDLIMLEYLTKQQQKREALLGMVSRYNNIDGFAMEWAVRRLARDYPEAPRRVLFVISDGQPSGEVGKGVGYGGEKAFQHMKSVVDFGDSTARVNTYGIGIANAYNQEEGDRMYGIGRSVVLSDISSCTGIISSFISRIAKLW